MFSAIGSLPKHRYVFVDSRFTHEEPCGYVPAVWFGLVSFPGRAWGCHVMLECGAVYRSLPPHALSFTENPEEWSVEQAQMWDCYGTRWSAEEYTYLRGLKVTCKVGGKLYDGDYLFTIAPLEDGFSEAPEQSKEFMFCKLANGRLTIQPTNRVLFEDRSFTGGEMPKLKLQTDTYSCEQNPPLTQCKPEPIPTQTLPFPNTHSPLLKIKNLFNSGKRVLIRIVRIFWHQNKYNP